MAVAAFKSSSRRPTNSSSLSSSKEETKPNSPNKPPTRRSRSVSAVSRSHLQTSSPSSDFLNKRDNPLYWTTVSPPDNENPKSSDADTRRGRSVSRNADVAENVFGSRKDIGRSLSSVYTGRRRSLSRGPVARTHHLNSESSSPTLSWDDGVLRSSFSEAEERTSRAICEQMKSFHGSQLGDDASSRIYETVRSEVRRAIADIQNDLESAVRRSNATAIAATNVTDIPPDLVNPSAVELVLDIRREYANKLEQSQERARKLRADLAVEEHRGLELNRILREVLPDPKISHVQKSRSGRKSSIERRKMSKRLTEEAMAYFDECVSLSTFDSSDFSSQEDPPISLVGISTPAGYLTSVSQANNSIAANHCVDNCPNDKQEWGTSTSRSKDCTPHESSEVRRGSQRFQFSIARNQNVTFEFQNDIGKYVKNFQRQNERVDINSQILRSNQSDLEEYNLLASSQSLLFDALFFRNKIESGCMLLCGGGMTCCFAFLI
ncbi:uncharacterized protein LOC110669820 isoform X2 [Hevea brasiliensis]|uniref:uncharacterized protein LOC110669820 isoform X2 n=1 Tax=Hevea brasiliensis TaxID=3981 RepID=UPI0025F5C154|nr:uncharacterized protein LOC110669820 isoform X2 [Hevea brasiliensis]